MVREVLEVFIRVCIFLDQPTFLSFVFKAISNRLDYVSFPVCGLYVNSEDNVTVILLCVMKNPKNKISMCHQ